jgi:hypothetical protein
MVSNNPGPPSRVSCTLRNGADGMCADSFSSALRLSVHTSIVLHKEVL